MQDERAYRASLYLQQAAKRWTSATQSWEDSRSFSSKARRLTIVGIIML